MASVELLQRDERELAEAASLLSATPATLVDGVRRKLEENKALQDACAPGLGREGRAAELAASGTDGLVVARGGSICLAGDLRDLAVAVRNQPNVRARRARRAQRHRRRAARRRAFSAGMGQAADVLREAARAVKGGGGGKGDIAVAEARIRAGWTRRCPSPPAQRALLDGAGGAGTGD